MTTPVVVVLPKTVHVFADSVDEAMEAFRAWSDADDQEKENNAQQPTTEERK